MANNIELLQTLADAEGFESVDDMLENSVWDSIIPGICIVCGATAECEPDARANHCDNCGGPGIQSGLVLAGII